jgi:hypothetical protein
VSCAHSSLFYLDQHGRIVFFLYSIYEDSLNCGCLRDLHLHAWMVEIRGKKRYG